MNEAQIDLVQATWRHVTPISDQAADLFYGRLFELDPALRSMFPDNLATQKRKLMAMIGRAVAALRDLEALVPTVRALGVNHAGYGVRDEHYATVAQALLWTLERGLGDAWNDEVRAAWTDVYALLATAMKDAARTAQLEATDA
jgi:hemoglobin-like flavoprotein